MPTINRKRYYLTFKFFRYVNSSRSNLIYFSISTSQKSKNWSRTRKYSAACASVRRARGMSLERSSETGWRVVSWSTRYSVRGRVRRRGRSQVSPSNLFSFKDSNIPSLRVYSCWFQCTTLVLPLCSSTFPTPCLPKQQKLSRAHANCP